MIKTGDRRKGKRRTNKEGERDNGERRMIEE